MTISETALTLMASIFGPQWRREKTPLQCLTYLCLSETLADVHFTFTDGGKPLPGHKFVLAMRSEEFEQMFYTEIPQPEILIEGTSKETFQMLLRYKQIMVMGCFIFPVLEYRVI